MLSNRTINFGILTNRLNLLALKPQILTALCILMIQYDCEI